MVHPSHVQYFFCLYIILMISVKERKIIPMRKIKLPDEFDMDFCQKEKAMKETERCVYCGSERIKQSKPKVIKVKEGLFKKKIMHEVVCKCKDCGAKYATDPYPMKKKDKIKNNEKRKYPNIIPAITCLGCWIGSIIIECLIIQYNGEPIILGALLFFLLFIPLLITIIKTINDEIDSYDGYWVAALVVSIALFVIEPISCAKLLTNHVDVYVHDDNGNVIKAYKYINEGYIEYIDDNNVSIYDRNTGNYEYYSKNKITIKDE